MQRPNLPAAKNFVWRHARLLDRHRFSYLFLGGEPEPVVSALRAYQNPDGGFGHALEPDLRGPASQPGPAEHALQILDEVDCFDPEVVSRTCDWLDAVATSEGGVPFVRASVADGPHAPWWVPSGEASLNPTAGIVGLLLKNGVDHPWVARGSEYCFSALPSRRGSLSPDDAISVLTLLQHASDRAAAEAEFDVLGERILGELVALDPDTSGYVKVPLDFAPEPTRLARRLFDDPTIERHLDALAEAQQPDGGWLISWEPPSETAEWEWRGFMTVKWLTVLRAYGRLPR